MTRKYKWVLLGLCLAVVAAWIVLVSGIVRKNPKKTATDETKVTQNVTQNGTPGATQPVTTEDGMVTVWLLERVYLSYDRSKTELQKSFRYDGNGRLVSCIHEEWGEYFYEYDDKNHLIKEILESSPTGGDRTRIETVYRSNGQEALSRTYYIRDDGSFVLNYEEVKDEAGRTVSDFWCDNDGNFLEGNKTEYDKNGFVISHQWFDPERGEWIVVLESVCDEEERVTEQYFVEWKGEDAVKTLTDEYTYNADGSVEQKIHPRGYSGLRKFDATGRVTYEEYQTGAVGQKNAVYYNYTETEDQITDEMKFYVDETYQYTLTTQYNLQGEIVFEKTVSADGTEVVYKNRYYDEEGNLIIYSDGLTTKVEFDDYGNRIRETVSGTPLNPPGSDPVDLLYVYEYTSVTIPIETAEENAMFYSPTRLH